MKARERERSFERRRERRSEEEAAKRAAARRRASEGKGRRTKLFQTYQALNSPIEIGYYSLAVMCVVLFIIDTCSNKMII